MPTSNLALWPAILNLVYETPHRRVLDVGPGWGKAGVLLREYCGCEVVDAVELWEPYVTPRLRANYDTVLRADICAVPGFALSTYDVVLMIEVLEHLEKADGLELLDRIDCPVVVCTPAEFFQNPEHELVPPETHRSLWSVEDFGERLEIDASQMGGVLVRLGRRAA
jgi:hypothetical protein